MWQIITNRNLLLSHKNTAFEMTFPLAKMDEWLDIWDQLNKRQFYFWESLILGKAVLDHSDWPARTNPAYDRPIPRWKVAVENWSAVVGIHYSPSRLMDNMVIFQDVVLRSKMFVESALQHFFSASTPFLCKIWLDHTKHQYDNHFSDITKSPST